MCGEAHAQVLTSCVLRVLCMLRALCMCVLVERDFDDGFNFSTDLPHHHRSEATLKTQTVTKTIHLNWLDNGDIINNMLSAHSICDRGFKSVCADRKGIFFAIIGLVITGKFTPKIKKATGPLQPGHSRYKIEIATIQFNPQFPGTFKGAAAFNEHKLTDVVMRSKGLGWHTGLDYVLRLHVLKMIERVVKTPHFPREEVLRSIKATRVAIFKDFSTFLTQCKATKIKKLRWRSVTSAHGDLATLLSSDPPRDALLWDLECSACLQEIVYKKYFCIQCHVSLCASCEDDHDVDHTLTQSKKRSRPPELPAEDKDDGEAIPKGEDNGKAITPYADYDNQQDQKEEYWKANYVKKHRKVDGEYEFMVSWEGVQDNGK